MYKINADLKNVDAFRFGYDPMPVWFLDLFTTEINQHYLRDTHHVRRTYNWLTIETYETIDGAGNIKMKDSIEIQLGQWVCKYIGTDNKIRVFDNDDFKKQFVKCDKLIDYETLIYVVMSVIAGILIIAIFF